MARLKIKPGDIFSIPVKGENYLFGRVLLDVKNQCIKTKLIDPMSRFSTYVSAILVEVYCDLSKKQYLENSKVLIPGIFVDLDAFEENLWNKISYKEVDPKEVEFPQALTESAIDPQFERGEIIVSLDIDMEEAEQFESRPTINASFCLGQMGLYHLNQKELMDIEPKYRENMSARLCDFRFSDQMEKMYQILQDKYLSKQPDLRPDEPYYELSKRLGKDISRFY